VQCLSSNPPPIPFNVRTDGDRQSYQLGWIALRALIVDTVDLVSRAINAKIKTDMDSDDATVIGTAKKRKENLRKWSKMSNPLSYSSSKTNRNDVFSLLLQVVVENHNDYHHGLPSPPTSTVTYIDLGKRLYDMGKEHKPTRISYPIDTKGFFQSILPLAIQHLSRRCGKESEGEYIPHILSTCAQVMGINFLPWNDQGTGRGQPPRTPRHDLWVVLGQSKEQNRSRQFHGIKSTAQMADEAAISISAEDPNAPWSAFGSSDDLSIMGQKIVLPTEWGLVHASLEEDDYVRKTYEYVHDRYDGTYWKHHMGLIWGILFSKVAPFITYHKPDTEPLRQIQDPVILTEAMLHLPWTATQSSRKGTTWRNPLLTMMTTYIIAMMDDKSPLRQHMRQNRQALGAKWTKKHGMMTFDIDGSDLTIITFRR
jgi:hypothetical protein